MRELIIKMWNSGKTSGEIATTLKLTRSQVMGAVNRAQKRGEAEKRGAPPPLIKPNERVKAIRLRPKIITPLKSAPSPKVEEKPVAPVVPPPEPKNTKGTKTLMQLGAYDCRYILDDRKFCGARAKSSRTPWCEEHHKLVYVPGTGKKNLRVLFRF